MSVATAPTLWPGMTFLERGWLSANSVVFWDDAAHASVVDTGYGAHAAQTVQLIAQTMGTRQLQRILNTHLHSDHCGGNAALQTHWPQVQTWVAPGHIAHVQVWNPDLLGYTPTGQACPSFRADHALQPGHDIELGGRAWQVHAAPGHDPHAIILFEPQRRLLISADALWEHGFGVVFPEIEGVQAFHEVAATLDIIEALQPALILPGHGAMFDNARAAIATARQRLQAFVHQPERHARYTAKVLLKYKLLEWQQRPLHAVWQWCLQTPYMVMLHAQYFGHLPWQTWLCSIVDELERSGAAQRQQQDAVVWLHNR